MLLPNNRNHTFPKERLLGKGKVPVPPAVSESTFLPFVTCKGIQWWHRGKGLLLDDAWPALHWQGSIKMHICWWSIQRHFTFPRCSCNIQALPPHKYTGFHNDNLVVCLHILFWGYNELAVHSDAAASPRVMLPWKSQLQYRQDELEIKVSVIPMYYLFGFPLGWCLLAVIDHPTTLFT